MGKGTANVNDLMSGGGLSLAILTGNVVSNPREYDSVAGGPCWVKKVIVFAENNTNLQAELHNSATVGAQPGDLCFGASADDGYTAEMAGKGIYFDTDLSVGIRAFVPPTDECRVYVWYYLE